MQETEEDDKEIKGGTGTIKQASQSISEPQKLIKRSCEVKCCTARASMCSCALPQYLSNHCVFQLCGDIVVQF